MYYPELRGKVTVRVATCLIGSQFFLVESVDDLSSNQLMYEDLVYGGLQIQNVPS